MLGLFQASGRNRCRHDPGAAFPRIGVADRITDRAAVGPRDEVELTATTQQKEPEHDHDHRQSGA